MLGQTSHRNAVVVGVIAVDDATGMVRLTRPSKLRFCIDRYEYPNLRGVRPVVMVDYFQAENACEIEGKRLCEAEEWTFACEGVGTWPLSQLTNPGLRAVQQAITTLIDAGLI